MRANLSILPSAAEAACAALILAYVSAVAEEASPGSATAVAGADDAAPALGLPLDCTPGVTCFVQSYVDHDPGPNASDYMCQGATYEGHSGTDFRLPSLPAASRTDVIAAAAGTVVSVRNSVRDHDPRSIDRASVEGIECGNGVLLDHGGGWQTQYCHMRLGSVSVRPGDRVAAGQPLGRVGLSGDTEFAHLHLSVRHQGEEVDPFARHARLGQCAGEAQPIWAETAARQLTYQRSALLNAGFATRPVEMEAIELGELEQPTSDSPALVAYVRAINLKAGDRLMLQLIGPDGSVIAENAAGPLDRDKAQWMLFTGRRIREGGWQPGRYSGRIQVENAGKRVIQETFEMSIGG